MACSNVTFDINGEIITDDCVNGTWMDRNFNGGWTNYSFLMDQYSELRDDPGYQAKDIKNEQEITIYNNTKLKINIEGKYLSLRCGVNSFNFWPMLVLKTKQLNSGLISPISKFWWDINFWHFAPNIASRIYRFMFYEMFKRKIWKKYIGISNKNYVSRFTFQGASMN